MRLGQTIFEKHENQDHNSIRYKTDAEEVDAKLENGMEEIELGKHSSVIQNPDAI